MVLSKGYFTKIMIKYKVFFERPLMHHSTYQIEAHGKFIY